MYILGRLTNINLVSTTFHKAYKPVKFRLGVTVAQLQYIQVSPTDIVVWSSNPGLEDGDPSQFDNLSFYECSQITQLLMMGHQPMKASKFLLI